MWCTYTLTGNAIRKSDFLIVGLLSYLWGRNYYSVFLHNIVSNYLPINVKRYSFYQNQGMSQVILLYVVNNIFIKCCRRLGY